VGLKFLTTADSCFIGFHRNLLFVRLCPINPACLANFSKRRFTTKRFSTCDFIGGGVWRVCFWSYFWKSQRASL
jgi:hypothetical protein